MCIIVHDFFLEILDYINEIHKLIIIVLTTDDNETFIHTNQMFSTAKCVKI